MKFERTIKVKLSPDELAEIVKDYLEKEGFEVEKNRVDFKASTHIEGIGMGEYPVIKFDCCEVTCKVKTERN